MKHRVEVVLMTTQQVVMKVENLMLSYTRQDPLSSERSEGKCM